MKLPASARRLAAAWRDLGSRWRRLFPAGGEASAEGAPSFPAPFVVGVPRSGTTLLRLMLDAHPGLALPPETGFLLPLVRAEAPVAPKSPAELLAAVAGYHTWSDFGLSAGDYGRELDRLEPFDLAEGVRIFYRLYAAKLGKPGWGDKTPAYGPHLEALHRLLPEARFVHIYRDGRDVALSLREVWFAPSRDPAGLGRFWAERLEEIRRAGRRVPRYLEVRYEDLVREPEATLRTVCRFLDLPFHHAVLGHAESAERRLSEVQDQHLPGGRVVTRETRLFQQRHVTSPANPSSVGRHRSGMTLGERRAFESVAGPLLFELGYEVGSEG